MTESKNTLITHLHNAGFKNMFETAKSCSFKNEKELEDLFYEIAENGDLENDEELQSAWRQGAEDAYMRICDLCGYN